MTHDELERMVLSHERALLVVADTEGKSLEAFHVAIGIAFVATVIAIVALMAVMCR